MIVHIPHQTLYNKTKRVSVIDKKIKALVADMIVALREQKDPEGVGLAANQVGVGLSIFIMRPNKKQKPIVCINPEIVEMEKMPSKLQAQRSKDKDTKKTRLEGCLSIPLMWGHVERSPRVVLKYTDLHGETKQEQLTGFSAIICQHEMDHLNGILFTQRVLEQKQKLYREEGGELKPYIV